MKTSEILEKAMDLIRDPECWIKWHSYVQVNGKDCYCAIGAIEYASNGIGAPGFCEAYTFLCQSINDIEKKPALVGTWNAAQERTHDEVITVFEEAKRRAIKVEKLSVNGV